MEPIKDTQIKAEDEYETAGTSKIEGETSVSTVVENEINDTENQSGTIYHKGYSSDDIRQQMVQKAYNLGGIDFVKMIECENGQWNPLAVGDGGHAYGLCQMNSNYHDIPQEYYDDRGYQIEYCYQKWKSGTKFYGPSRVIKGQRCSSYVSNRFILN